MDITNFYNNNDLVYSTQEINYLNQYYKMNYNKYNSYSDFVAPISALLDKNIFVQAEFYKQYLVQKAIQPGFLVELNIAATIAKILKLQPVQGLDLYTYANSKYKIEMSGNLGKSSGTIHDLILTDLSTKQIYQCEIKDQIARAGEMDLRYTEEGKLYKAPKAKNIEGFQFFIDAFNATHSVFDYVGTNYQIKDLDNCGIVVQKYFDNVDILFTYLDDKMVTIPFIFLSNAQIVKLFSFQNSEIRTLNGKNAVNIYTPHYFATMIRDKSFLISEDATTYIFDATMLKPCVGRGKNEITKYIIPYGFSIKAKDVHIVDNNLIVKKNKVKQNNANISIHIALAQNYEDIKTLVVQEGGEDGLLI